MTRTPLLLDAKLLRALRNAAVHLPLSELVAICESPADQVVKRLGAVREAGFEIEEHPHFGYKLIAAPDRLIADDLRALIGERALIREIIVLEKTNSTNDVAAQFGRDGAAEGVIVFSETQTAGRGRLGRKWESDSHQGLWFSILLRPQLGGPFLNRLTTWAAVAIARGIELITTCRASIKWPNDIHIDDKKVAGILIETFDGGTFAVAGMGVNANQPHFPPELANRAASLRQLTGIRIDRPKLAAAILQQLDELYPLVRDGFEKIVAEARSRSCVLGREITIGDGQNAVSGTAEALDSEGALIFKKEDGEVLTLTGGEARFSEREI